MCLGQCVVAVSVMAEQGSGYRVKWQRHPQEAILGVALRGAWGRRRIGKMRCAGKRPSEIQRAFRGSLGVNCPGLVDFAILSQACAIALSLT